MALTPLVNTSGTESASIRQRRPCLWFLVFALLFFSSAVVMPVSAYDHPMLWNVSHIAGNGNYTNVSLIPEIGTGDTIRIWGTDGHTYEGGFTIGMADVTVRQWEGSPVRPLLTNTLHTAPAITITADNVTLAGLNISGNTYAGAGAGVQARGADGSHLQGLTITGCVFAGNGAMTPVDDHEDCGGAVSIYHVDDSEITDTTFSGNMAGEHGGGIFISDSPSPVLTDVVFTQNEAAERGGGIDILNSAAPALTRTIFANNTAGTFGGGAYCYGANSAVVTDATFTNNTADYGGGLYVEQSGTPRVSGTSFIDNRANDNGGGCYFISSPSADIQDAAFTRNTAKVGGGAYFYNSALAAITNVTCTGNTATNYGGGSCFTNSANAAITRSTYSGNTATNRGGACYFSNADNAVITDTTYTGNTAATEGGGCYLVTGSDDVTFTNISAGTGTGDDFSVSAECTGVSFTNLTFRDEVDTSVSFTFGGAMQIAGAAGTPPADPAGYANIGHFVNVTAPNWMNLHVRYTDADVVGFNASTLNLWDTTGSEWEEIAGTNGVNTAEKYVFANLEGLSGWHTIAPFGDFVGGFQINSSPAGGWIWIDGVNRSVQTNAMVAEIAPGVNHNVTVVLDDYYAGINESVNFSAGRVTDVFYTLTPVGSKPAASFTATPVSGDAPLRVTFTDTSTGDPQTWDWSFGDGCFSAEQNPVHTYQSAGTYTVSLTATNVYGSNTWEKVLVVTVSSHTIRRDSDDPTPFVASTPTATPTPAPVPATLRPAPPTPMTAPAEFTGTGSLPVGPTGGVGGTVIIRADDLSGYLTIDAGVVARDASGRPVETVSIVGVPVAAIPSPGNISPLDHPAARYAYDCAPDGITFNPAITLTFTLTADEWDLCGGQAQAAWFNSMSGEWEVIAGVADADKRTITIPVSHFSTYALFAEYVPEVALPNMTGMPAGEPGCSPLWLWGGLLVAVAVMGTILRIWRIRDE